MTARKLYHAARKTGITLTPQGESIAFKAPPGAMTQEIADEIKRIKPELNALLNGWYLDAAQVLIIRETDGDERVSLARRFDERVRICTAAGKSYDEAFRVAYIELAKSIEAVHCRREGAVA